MFSSTPTLRQGDTLPRVEWILISGTQREILNASYFYFALFRINYVQTEVRLEVVAVKEVAGFLR